MIKVTYSHLLKKKKKKKTNNLNLRKKLSIENNF